MPIFSASFISPIFASVNWCSIVPVEGRKQSITDYALLYLTIGNSETRIPEVKL